MAEVADPAVESKEARRARKKADKKRKTTTIELVTAPTPATDDEGAREKERANKEKESDQELVDAPPAPAPLDDNDLASADAAEEKKRRKADKKARKQLAKQVADYLATAPTPVPAAPSEPVLEKKEKKKKRKHDEAVPSTFELAPPPQEEEVDAAAEAKRLRKLQKKEAKRLAAEAGTSEAGAEEVVEPPKKKSKKGKEKEVIPPLPAAPATPQPTLTESKAAEQTLEAAKALEKEARRLRKKARKLAEEKERMMEAGAQVEEAAVEPPKKKSRKGKEKELQPVEVSILASFLSTFNSRLSQSPSIQPSPAPQPAPTPSTKNATPSTSARQQATSSSVQTPPSKKAAAPRGKTAVDYAVLSSRELLSTQWLPLTKIKELADQYKFEYKKGKFTKVEDAILHGALDDYATSNSLSDAELLAIIFAKGPAARRALEPTAAFWTTLASKLDGRPVLSVYNHIKRIKAPNHAMGKWTKAEDQALMDGVTEFGNGWEKISEKVGRLAGDCRDRWRTKVGPIGTTLPAAKETEGEKEKLKRGAWEPKEIKRLKKAVKKLGENWAAVARKVKSRSESGCRREWREVLARTGTLIDGKPLKWSAEYRSNLIAAVTNLNVTAASDLDFRAIDDPLLKPFGPRSLGGYWNTLVSQATKSGVEDSHLDQLQWLTEQYSGSETTIKLKRTTEKSEKKKEREEKKKEAQKKKEHKSKEFVDSSDEEDSEEEEEEGGKKGPAASGDGSDETDGSESDDD